MALLKLLVLAYIISIVLVIVMSWFPMAPDSAGQQIFSFFRRITDPVLVPLRRIIPPVGGVIDLSPTIVLFVLLTIYNML